MGPLCGFCWPRCWRVIDSGRFYPLLSRGSTATDYGGAETAYYYDVVQNAMGNSYVGNHGSLKEDFAWLPPSCNLRSLLVPSPL